MTETSTCGGQCCAVFSWPLEWDPQKTVDGEMIEDMLIPLTPDEVDARAEKFNVPPVGHDVLAEKGRGSFTCRHWDEGTRLCTVYDTRPRMCRNYPYEGSCMHGCTFCVAPEVQAAYRVSRERWERYRAAHRKSDGATAILLRDPRVGRVVGHWMQGLSGKTRCGRSLVGARVVSDTATIENCRTCKRTPLKKSA